MTDRASEGIGNIDPASLPELETPIGMSAAASALDVGGIYCVETGVIVAMPSVRD